MMEMCKACGEREALENKDFCDQCSRMDHYHRTDLLLKRRTAEAAEYSTRLLEEHIARIKATEAAEKSRIEAFNEGLRQRAEAQAQTVARTAEAAQVGGSVEAQG